MRFIALLLLAAAGCAGPVEDRIRAVETGLSTRVVVKGKTPRYTLEERMRALNVRGVSIAVVNNYRIEWAKGYGLADLDSKRPVTPDTLFQAGSISKPVAGVGALKLVENGKLKLDGSVNNFLKSWKLPPSELAPDGSVSLRRLLSHSAGLTVHGFPGYAAGKPVPSVQQILDGQPPANTAAIRVDIPPGSRFRYSGGGYTLMQLMMTDVTGKDFASLLHELVLKPAGMAASTYEQPLPARFVPAAASGYRSNGDLVPGRYHTYPEMAAAGLWTTPTDLARFMIEVQKSREGRSNRILSRATVEQMLTEQQKPYGLGFALEEEGGIRRFGHGGADEGFQAAFSSTFDGRGYVIMTNSDNGGRLAGEIALAIAAAYGLPDKPREREAASLSREALERIAGTYSAAQIGTVTIRAAAGRLELAAPRIGTIELFPESDRRFFSLGAVPDLTFTFDGDGKATGFEGGGVSAKRVK